jgi:DNA-binding NarL/FixJ family response regulator
MPKKRRITYTILIFEKKTSFCSCKDINFQERDQLRGIMKNRKHSILVVDDHPIIHDGVSILLSSEPDLEVSAHAMSSSEALDQLEDGLPDLAIVDLSMGDSDGTYLIQRVHARFPNLRILVYTMSEERLFAERTFMAGALGYVMKTSQPTVLKKAIRTVLAGNLCFHPDIQARIERKQNGRASGKQSVLDRLSNREMDIFKLLGEGLNSIKIAEKLDISRNTVDTHRINIKNKLDMANGKALERFAFEMLHKQQEE